MQNIREASNTGYVESIHKKLRVLEMKCDSSRKSESLQAVPDTDASVQHERQGSLKRGMPAATMRGCVQNNSLHLHKLTLQNITSAQSISTI